MSSAKAGDTLIFDRGYYSNELIRVAAQYKLKVVFRLKKNAFRGAAAFWNSNKTRALTRIQHNDNTHTNVLLVKYFIDGKKYMNLVNFNTDTDSVRKLYALRWRVETSFKRLKSYLNLEDSHSMTPELYIQEIQARILLDTVTQHLKKTNNTKAVHEHDKKIESYLKVLDDFTNI
eukprot:10323-Heterococcus_DN1.PRE.11